MTDLWPLVGAAVNPTSGQTWQQAISAFETLTGRPLPVRRCYDGAPPSTVATSQLRHDLGVRKSVYSIKPTMTTPLTTLQSLANDIIATGAVVDVIIYHQPVDNMSGPDFINLYKRSAPPFRSAGVKVGVCYSNYSCNLPYSDSRSALRYYWPPTGLVDFIGIDEYPIGEITATADAPPMDVRTRRACQFADSLGVPLGLSEWGVDASWPVTKSAQWMRSVTDWGRERSLLGVPLRWSCYFNIAPYAMTHAEYVDAYDNQSDLLM
ncbi:MULTISPECIES: hypothetical protein [unclassified Actinomadura]|uniref:hypothetical protein n=1 Tax=unclassified Actinomadura TaxID=2626254 RepID=UPI0011EF84B1|nr:hypothetical protein [Actinomadura sp. K4S16]